MIAQIDLHNGILPYDDVVRTWGQDVVDIAIKETKVLLINLWQPRPGVDLSKCTLNDGFSHKGMGVATFSWNQEWPAWLQN